MSVRALPSWFRQPIPSQVTLKRMAAVRASGCRTVCREARCPNFGSCLDAGRLTFLILGPVCTRRCAFCSVDKSTAPHSVDSKEPARIVAVLKEFACRWCVVTSVTRDDLADGGAEQFCAVIRAVREQVSGAGIEVLLPDFNGDPRSCAKIAGARPDVAGHNIETVKRLYPELRPQARYERSLEMLARLRALDAARLIKSSLMLGLGETEEEILAAMSDMRSAGCDVLALGQYLAPSPDHAPVKEYVTPAKFARLRQAGLKQGFKAVLAGPLVRSSYKAEELFDSCRSVCHCETP
jgi:lipoyl synthase